MATMPTAMKNGRKHVRPAVTSLQNPTPAATELVDTEILRSVRAAWYQSDVGGE